MEKEAPVLIEKRINGRPTALLGAAECGTVISFFLKVPRSMGAAAVVCRIAADGTDGDNSRYIPHSVGDRNASACGDKILDALTGE